MASFLEKIRIRSAKRPVKSFDLSRQHLTSQNFNQYMPIMSQYMMRGSSIDVNATTFERFEPMPQPTFMESKTCNRAFFVPYKYVWRPWEHFINNEWIPTSNGQVKVDYSPYFTAQTFLDWFTHPDHVVNELDTTVHPSHLGQQNPYPGVSDFDMFDLRSTIFLVKRLVYAEYGPVTTDIANYDIVVMPPLDDYSTLNPNCYTLTAKGRLILKVFESLGYKFDFVNMNHHTSAYLNQKFCALPILSYCKCLLDWFYPSQYVNGTNDYAAMNLILNKEVGFTLTSGYLDIIANFISNFYLPADYFTSCFDNTSVPNTLSQSSMNIVYRDQIDQTPNIPVNTPVNNVSTSSNSQPKLDTSNTLDSHINVSGTVTQWGISMLSALSSYMKRNQMAGARIVDRVLSRFGVKLDDCQLERSVFLGEDSFWSSMGDVISTNQTEDGSTLAQLAGKGTAFSNKGKFSFTTNQEGLFIIINFVSPRVSYTQGLDRNVLHCTALDFYTPEFDSIGEQSVKIQELISPRSVFDLVNQPVTNDALIQLKNAYDYDVAKTLPRSHFGFQNRYAEFKVSKDLVTGNFSNPSTGIGYPTWINSRLFTLYSAGSVDIDDSGETPVMTADFYNNFDSLVHSKDFCNDNSYQYNRLFYNQNSLSDNILCQHYFDVKYRAPMANLFDTFEFENQNFGDDIKLNSASAPLD